jgi:hypothetical protein
MYQASSSEQGIGHAAAVITGGHQWHMHTPGPLAAATAAAAESMPAVWDSGSRLQAAPMHAWLNVTVDSRGIPLAVDSVRLLLLLPLPCSSSCTTTTAI